MANTLPQPFTPPYEIDPRFEKGVVYFSMEYAIDQSLKIYSGGLGFLAGSHMRSAYQLRQNLTGIGILWKNGYYDQRRNADQTMQVCFEEKSYKFLTDTGIKFTVEINHAQVWVKAYYLDPKIFGTAPLFLLTTDLEENDFLARSTTFRLYDSDPQAKIAASIVLGRGGVKLLEQLGYEPDLIHLNEAHGVSAAFALYEKYGSLEEVKKRMVFTTHTPEEAGNEKHPFDLLANMSFFGHIPLDVAQQLSGVKDGVFNHSLAALRMSHLANGVSKLHGEVARQMWAGNEGIPPITHVTNAQNKSYWADYILEQARVTGNELLLTARKNALKKSLFDHVADQCGTILDPQVLTIVWSRRFAQYKRPDLLTQDVERFHRLMENTKMPVQIIWAGNPYTTDYGAISVFNKLVDMSKHYKNMAVLVGYELWLSRKLKLGADIWLNNPRITREASGTSGMTAAMNAAINFSTYDGWIPEFAKDGVNSFIIPPQDYRLPTYEQDTLDRNNMFDILENKIIPMYYGDRKGWTQMMMASMNDVVPFFDSARMATEYYEKIYNAPVDAPAGE